MSRSHFYNADDRRAAFGPSQPLSRGLFRNKRHKSHSALNFGNAPAFCVDVRESPPPMAMTESGSPPPAVGCRPTRRRYDVSQPSTSHSITAVLPPRISQALKSLRSGLGMANLISSSSSSSKFKPAYVDADDVVYYANRDTNNFAKAKAAASVREFAAATNGGALAPSQPLSKRVSGSARNLAVSAFPAELAEEEGRSSSPSKSGNTGCRDAASGNNASAADYAEEYYDNHRGVSSAKKNSGFSHNQFNKHFDGTAGYCNPTPATEKLYDELPKVDVKTSKTSIYQRNRTLAEIRQLYKSTPNFSVYDNEGDEEDEAENEDDEDFDYDCVVDEECCYEDDLTGHAFNHANTEAFYRQQMRRSFGAAATTASKTTSGDRAVAAFQRYQQQYPPPSPQPFPSALRRGSVNVLSSGNGLLSSPPTAQKRFSQLAASLSKMSIGGDADLDSGGGGKFASSCGATVDGDDARQSVVTTARLMHTRPSPVLGASCCINGGGNLASVATADQRSTTEEFSHHHTKYSTNRSNSTVSSNASSSLEDRLRKTKAIFEGAFGVNSDDLPFSALSPRAEESLTIAAGSLPPAHASSPTDSGYRSRRQTPRVKKHTHCDDGQRQKAGRPGEEEGDEYAPQCVPSLAVNRALIDFNDRFAAGLLHSSTDTVQRFVHCMFDMLALSAATTASNDNNNAVVDSNNNNDIVTSLGQLSPSNRNSTPPNTSSSASPSSIPLECAQIISRQFAIASGTKTRQQSNVRHLRDGKSSVDVGKKRLDEKDEDDDVASSLNHHRHHRFILIDPRYIDSAEMADIRFSVRQKHRDLEEDGAEEEESNKDRGDEMVLVHAHRIVLANSTGGRLRRLVEESRDGEWPIVLEDLDRDTLRMMLRYLYGDVDGFLAAFRQLSPRRQIAVLLAAQRYDLTALGGECETVVIDSLNPRNCVLVYRQVSGFGELLVHLKTACEDFLLLNLPKVFTEYPAFVDDLSKSSSSMMSRGGKDDANLDGGECVKEALTKRFVSVFLKSSSSG